MFVRLLSFFLLYVYTHYRLCATFHCSGKIVPKESKHWVKMPKLYIQLKKSPPLQRWKSLEAPSSPTPPTQPTVMDIPPSPRMGSSIQKECSTLDKTPIRNSHSENTIKPVSNAAQNVTKPVEKKNSLPLAGGAGTAAAAVKVGTAVKLAETSCTGLINIGNTCYMNSIIQSLSNTCELRDYLISELIGIDLYVMLLMCGIMHPYAYLHTCMYHVCIQYVHIYVYTCAYTCVCSHAHTCTI